MGITPNAPGIKYAKSLINRGKVDRTSDWEFTAEDGNKILGPDLDDWAFYGKVHIGKDESKDEDTKAHWKFPVIKGGQVYRSGVIAAKSRAAQSKYTEVEEAADELLKLIDAKKGDSSEDRVYRRDISDFLWDNCTSKMQKTHDGFLQGRACLTNVGVFPYPQPDGSTRMELRCPDEVFDPESLATLNGKPLTNDHPPEGVKPETAKMLQVGSIASPSTDPYRVYGNVSVTDADAIRDVSSGKRALSCGYTCELDATPGVWMGVPYTHVQRKIRYNHVAIVDRGRAGDDAVLRSDGATSINIHSTHSEGSTMRKIRLDNGVEAEADEFVIQALDAAKDKAKKAEGDKDKAEKDAKAKDEELDAKSKELDKAKGELDAAKEKVKKLEEELKEKCDSKAFDAAVTSRMKLLDTAKSFGAEVAVDAAPADVKVAVIKLVSKDFKADGLSEAYLDGRFDAAVADLAKSKAHTGTRALGDLPSRQDTDVALDEAAVEKARSDSRANLFGAWDKTPARS